MAIFVYHLNDLKINFFKIKPKIIKIKINWKIYSFKKSIIFKYLLIKSVN